MGSSPFSPQLYTLKAEYNSSISPKVTMRFWNLNAFVPIVLIPIVAATFHSGLVACYIGDDWQTANNTVFFTGIFPENQNTCQDTSNPNSLFYQQQKNNTNSTTVIASPCGSTITLDGHEWTSSDGRFGQCTQQIANGKPVPYVLKPCQNANGKCNYFDTWTCITDLCNP
ncbi:uncharacterized protein EI90DRAFT_3034307 [Cantharellus anzutake]|uniref:uncharacterized protein n=1 Tax=Cantharellus anzutake TaxID=1750568 RepID=UPI0019075547|nr:uncharacterized protein EI90DRAFT_3034307 [Cantharellus anzutake]KAF8341545.1 hypothetical protein EI90DRAFT_3034307 [Cantharellus anzutake]